MSFDLSSQPHRRKNLLTGEWVLVSPQRGKRPWQGQQEKPSLEKQVTYDQDCYLCPGNTRANGEKNPQYEGCFVFDNDFPALLPPQNGSVPMDDLLQSEPESGICRVICYHPNHSLTMANIELSHIEEVVRCWQAQSKELSQRAEIGYIQIFENKGQAMGCSNPHPHGQIWASASVPDIPQKETEQQKAYFQRHGRSLLAAYLEREQKEGQRLLYENESFAVVVPWWAVWPYESLVIPKIHAPDIRNLSEPEVSGLSVALQALSRAYDRLFDCSFPYSMGIHQAPTKGSHPEWHWHMHFYPPLLRSASVRKFMVGYEMMAWPQRDLTAEQAAQKLAACFD